MNIPADVEYTADHEWVRMDGDTATVGITAYAADALGDVVYIELPDRGQAISVGNPCGEIESTKSVSDLLAPVDGEVVEVNSRVIDEPSLVNSDPYGEGWLIRIRSSGHLDLMDASQYRSLTSGDAS